MIEEEEPERPVAPYHPSMGRPKKWMHAYLIFVKERKSSMQKERPNLSFREMMQFVASQWKEINAADRAYFEAKAVAERERYNRQMSEYTTWCRANPGAAACHNVPKGKGSRRRADWSVAH